MTKKEFEKASISEQKKGLQILFDTLKRLERVLPKINKAWGMIAMKDNPSLLNFLRSDKNIIMVNDKKENVYPCGKSYKANTIHMQHLNHCEYCADFFKLMEDFSNIPVLKELDKIQKEQN